MVSQRPVAGERLPLTGINDPLPPALAIECGPSRTECDAALSRLVARLGVTPRQAAGPFGRGGGGAIPRASPELLETLVANIMRSDPCSDAQYPCCSRPPPSRSRARCG